MIHTDHLVWHPFQTPPQLNSNAKFVN